MNKRRAIKVCGLAAALLALSVVEAAARTITLAWTASIDAPVAGYRVYWSTQSGVYNAIDFFDAGESLSWTGDLPGDQYFFVVRSYDAGGIVGPPSLEVGDTKDFWLSNPGNQLNEAGQVVDLALLAHGGHVTYGAAGLPAGLELDAATGHIFGTVVASTAPFLRHVVTVAAVDAAGHISSVQFYWTVSTNHSPIATGPGNQTNVRGDAVELQINAVDPDSDRLQYLATNLPPGLKIDAASGIISGTVAPTAAGAFDVSVAVSDGRLLTTVAFAWHILVDQAVLVVDRVVAADAAGSTVTTPPLSTAFAGETLIAFVEAAQPTTHGAQTAVVSGGGLEWSLVARANAQAGTAEIWRARASARLSNVTVTADTSIGGTFLSLTVIAFAGADGVGAAAAASARSGAPKVSLTTTRPGSFVFGGGNDWDGAVSRTIPAGQELVHQWLGDAGDTFWVQRLSGAVAAAATPVTLTDTAPTDHRWNFSAVEILARAQPDPGGLSIDDVSMRETDTDVSTMIFTVTLSAASAGPVSVNYATVDGTAKAGSDYVANSGTLVFGPDTTTQTIAVQIVGDTADEPDERFTIVLSGATNAVIADASGIGTIADDDDGPTVDSKMFGFGASTAGHTRNRFVFRATESRGRDYARLEFWSSEPIKGKGVDDDDRQGHADKDYGRDHRAARNRFEATSVTSAVFGPRDNKGQWVTFAGAGVWNGKAGFTFEARAEDRGEPGRNRDTFALVVKDGRDNVVLNIGGTIDQGNIQSARSSKR
jgi:hypothetical protein